MNKKGIYWTSIEYKYSQQSSEFGKLAGGFVYGFVKASDEREALNKFVYELRNLHKNIKQIEFVLLYDTEIEWETEEQFNNYMQLYDEAQTSNEVLFDDFYAYETED